VAAAWRAGRDECDLKWGYNVPLLTQRAYDVTDYTTCFDRESQDLAIGLSRPRIARDVARRRRVRKVPPGELARYTVPIRGRTRVSPAAATARSLRRRREALIPVHLCYIARCANSRIFRFLSY
jgi:hypothetical protein